MNRDTDDELYRNLTETGRLLQNLTPIEGGDFSLDAILADFGSGAASSGSKKREPTQELPDVSQVEKPAPRKQPSPREQRMPEAWQKVWEEKQAEQRPSFDPGEPEGPTQQVPLEKVMSDTVEAVLDADDGILEKAPPLKERLAEGLASLLKKDAAPRKKRRVRQDTVALWDQPEELPEELEPEPDSELAFRKMRLRTKRLRRHLMWALPPVLAAAAWAALAEAGLLPASLGDNVLLNGIVQGGALALTALFVTDVWTAASEGWRQRHFTCEIAAGLSALVTMADCVFAVLTQAAERPLCAVSAAMLWLCQLGLYLQAKALFSGYRLCDMGGVPPYAVSPTAAGCVKQQGTLENYYRASDRSDPARLWQQTALPLLIGAATVLTGVVCLTQHEMSRFLWVWSVMLTMVVPFSLPLTGSLPLSWLSARLAKSGCAVAGYCGARAISSQRRMVVTDNDLFPPGTVGMNGLKVYGEEIGKVVSYAATMCQACRSQLTPLFDQLLSSEGGTYQPLSEFRFLEDGGVSGTIHGETVTMGSAAFMRRQHVTLPQGLKLKTGVFLAVDGQLIAIFAIKYQPSRNTEWALRALRRNHIQPVLACRSVNITPGLLKRKFNFDCRAVYPDANDRVVLSDAGQEQAARADAVIYREGLMPFAETVVGSRRLVRAVQAATVLTYVGALIGTLLTYYFCSVGSFHVLSPLWVLAFAVLWLIPTVLLSGLVKYF